MFDCPDASHTSPTRMSLIIKLSLLEFIFKKNGPPALGVDNFAFQSPISFDFVLNFSSRSISIYAS